MISPKKDRDLSVSTMPSGNKKKSSKIKTDEGHQIVFVSSHE